MYAICTLFNIASYIWSNFVCIIIVRYFEIILLLLWLMSIRWWSVVLDLIGVQSVTSVVLDLIGVQSVTSVVLDLIGVQSVMSVVVVVSSPGCWTWSHTRRRAWRGGKERRVNRTTATLQTTDWSSTLAARRTISTMNWPESSYTAVKRMQDTTTPSSKIAGTIQWRISCSDKC